MNYLVLVLLALTAIASADQVDLEDAIDLEDISAYGFLTRRVRRLLHVTGGGRVRNAEEFPYQAGLLVRSPAGTAVCGASLIRANRLLTAAHCWFDGRNQATSLNIVLGSISLYSEGTNVETSNVTVHESWNPNLVRNDIAMIRLASDVALKSDIAVIALPSGAQLNENYAGENATATGYGLTADGATINGGLNKVTLPVITNDVCKTTFKRLIQDSNICTNGADGKSTCGGDSGGPLAATRNNSHILIGITSFGSVRGCQAGYPAVFTRVTFYESWINSQM